MVPVVLVQFLLLTLINSLERNNKKHQTGSLRSAGRSFFFAGRLCHGFWTRWTECPHIWGDGLLLSVLEKRDLGQSSAPKTHLWKTHTHTLNTIISCVSLAPNLINPKKIREVLKTMWGSPERKITTQWLQINTHFNI